MIKVLIVDDHEMVRLGLSTYIGVQPDLEIVRTWDKRKNAAGNRWMQQRRPGYYFDGFGDAG